MAEHGRAGVWELLRVFSSTQSEPQRQAAGKALARLWRLDQLVAEEEQAIVRRGYTVTWSARRRYPRASRPRSRSRYPSRCRSSRTVPSASDRQTWNGRLVCSAPAAPLSKSIPHGPPAPAARSFTIVPGDFETNGPHRLVLVTRVRTAGLSDSWEIEPPHIPFNFEFDPTLELDAILTLPDAVRDEAVARAIRLKPAAPHDSSPAKYLSLGSEWTLRNPPRLAVETPLPCDLAHAISLEIDGSGARFPAGQLLLFGQGIPRHRATDRDGDIRFFELGPISPLPANLFERPGFRRMRVCLQADPAGGWAHPDIRSIWPGRTQTEWVEVEIVRR